MRLRGNSQSEEGIVCAVRQPAGAAGRGPRRAGPHYGNVVSPASNYSNPPTSAYLELNLYKNACHRRPTKLNRGRRRPRPDPALQPARKPRRS
ncbi:hypothetical protein EVAR_94521_1 [Eumeta japonica]|uniref:Uncharacterized protein n=1 Tax=Eumeta variegata TaxID=151549 RepID=A0A4C1UUN8_EUMVA|nr:hypothetical protein EVAR_94521_1 [Eumeta japonica]